MGSFTGHILPGSFFIGFAIWWTSQQYIRYFASWKQGVKFKSTCAYPLLCGKHNLVLFEPVLKIFVVAVGLFGEVYVGYDSNVGRFTLPANAQHATMFFVFGLTGVFDILTHLNVPAVPKDMDYAVCILALGVEGLLFHFHLHGRDELDVRLHTLLIYTIIFNILAVIAEMKYRHNFLAALSRSYFFLIQGTWFWQVGYILYNPNEAAEKWLPDDHYQLMMVTMYYTWHCGLVMLVMCAIGCLIACFYGLRYRSLKVGFNSRGVKLKTLKQTSEMNKIEHDDSADSEI